jgi:hypothetical protein
MLRKAVRPHDQRPVPPLTRAVLWTLCTLDVMVLVWMSTVGEWLDSASPITAVITLGGHHRVVLGVALAGFLVLAALAPATHGFAVARRWQSAALAVAGVLSAVALAGVLSVAGLLVGTVLLAALLLTNAPTRIEVLRRRR